MPSQNLDYQKFKIENTRVLARLKKNIGRHGDYICNIVHNHGALIAGGCLVACVKKWGIRKVLGVRDINRDIPNINIDYEHEKRINTTHLAPYKFFKVLKNKNMIQHDVFTINEHDMFARFSPMTDVDIYVPCGG